MMHRNNIYEVDQQRLEAFIFELIKRNVETQNDLLLLQRDFAREKGESFLTKDELLKTYHNLVKSQRVARNNNIERLLKIHQRRSLSGIIVVSVLTKPYDCPGNCLYCPTEKNLPKSYLSQEPAVMRAIANKFDPYHQTKNRLEALQATGHPIDKINIRIIGGTWSYYPKQYQTWFIKRVFEACNSFQTEADMRISGNTNSLRMGVNHSHRVLSLNQIQEINETAECRIVEISVETRQDYITPYEIKRLRHLGVTKVELGVQSIYDDVLHLNRRGNANVATIRATKMLRDAGFKISYQVMPNLPGSDFDRDLAMFDRIFRDPNYKPDYLKIYPLALVKEADLYALYQRGRYKPYSNDELVKLLKSIKEKVPPTCRVERVIRDIPTDYIVEGGSKTTNLRQIILEEMAREGKSCRCIRCREIHESFNANHQPELFREDYDAADGKEIFLSFESPDRKTLYSLLRLRIPSQHYNKVAHFLPVLNNSALIREIHTYGAQLPVGKNDKSASQHQGFGKRLLAEAENIAQSEFGVDKIAVIAGVGVREYFRKQGYKLEETYMVKKLNNNRPISNIQS